MLRWNTAANVSAAYRVDADVPVLIEGRQGALVGDHLLRHHLNDSLSVVEAQRASEASSSTSTVRELLEPTVDPLATLRAEAERTAESTHRGKVMDIHFQNYYPRLGLASNSLMRDRGDSRVVHADGDYLEWCAKIPLAYRKGTYPLSDRVVGSDAGGVPYGTSIAKLELCRRICPELADVVYERTKVKPSRPYPMHALGFVGNVVANRFRDEPTYGGGQLADFWIRDEDTALHRRVATLVEDATDRDVFNGDAVRELYDQHMAGSNNVTQLAQITTVEHWIQNHLD
jgi:asparagine synthase (glutamine-hydrolysing)